MVKRGMSGKTHTKQQLDNYANQKNPNNKAYKFNKKNQVIQKKLSKKEGSQLWLVWWLNFNYKKISKYI